MARGIAASGLHAPEDRMGFPVRHGGTFKRLKGRPGKPSGKPQENHWKKKTQDGGFHQQMVIFDRL